MSALADETGFTGVRLFSIGALEHPQPTWLDHPITFELWEVCANLGLRVLVACLPEHLSRLQRVLAQFPDQPVVLDHAGFVRPRRRSALPARRRRCSLSSSTPTCTSRSRRTCSRRRKRRATPVRSSTVSWASSARDRLVWGSDYPQTHDRSYADLVALAQHACRNLSAHDRALVLGGTALELWPELAR